MQKAKVIPCEAIYLTKTNIENDGLVSVVPELKKLYDDMAFIRDAIIEILEDKEKQGGIL